MTFPVVYQPAAKVAPGPTPGAKALMAWCLANYPPGTNLGIYNPRNVRGGVALSLHAEGRAIDVGYPVSRPDGHHMGQILAAHMAKFHADLGVQCVIFARKIWSNTRPTWRHYDGAADHFNHVHIELTREAAAGLTTDIIRQTLETPTVPTPITDRQSSQEAAQRAINGWLIPADQIEPDGDWGPVSTAALVKVLKAAETQIKGLTKELADAYTDVESYAREGERLALDLADIHANREAAEAEVAQLRKQLQTGGRLPDLLAAIDLASTDIGRAWDDLNEAIAKARA